MGDNIANLDEAEKCRDIAKTALRKGEWDKAIKWFEKSLRLYPLAGVEGMLKRAEEEKEKAARPPPERRASTNSMNGAASATSNGDDSSARSNGTPTQRAYTEEQEKGVQAVLDRKKSGGHYAVLGVEKNASEDEIKRAYKKLALKFHPDKNSAPHAEEAFKAIGTAVSVLTDADKRAAYDQFGEDDEGNSAGGGGHAGFRQRGQWGREPAPEDIFNMFFGIPPRGQGGAVRTNVHTFNFNQGFRQANRGGQGQAQQQGFSFWGIIQAMPMLLMLIFSLFGFNSGDPGFRMGPQQGFTLRRTTREAPGVAEGIAYYVPLDFTRSVARDRAQLAKVEKRVMEERKNELGAQCSRERMKREDMLYRAQRRRSPQDRKEATIQAQEYVPKGCEELTDLINISRYNQTGSKRRPSQPTANSGASGNSHGASGNSHSGRSRQASDEHGFGEL